jgi:UDP-N-acetylglucosamine 2-epimerase (non-hydrolysing)
VTRTVLHGGHVDLVVGTRPNFVKAAALHRAWAASRALPPLRLVATGQHHDAALGEEFGMALGLPAPDQRLGVPAGSPPGAQIGEVMIRYDALLARAPRPLAVIVVGDVSSTVAAALAAAKRDVPVVHLEAGLRSFEAELPEELNRVLVGRIARLHLASEPSAVDNLIREGAPRERVHFVGSCSVDSLRHTLQAVTATDGAPRAGVLATFHRPSNVDDPERLAALVQALVAIGARAHIVAPLHPRTRSALERHGLLARLAAHVEVTGPLDYAALARTLAGVRLVVTDSGGLQEETSALGVPCLTLRDATERPLTISHGTNELVGADAARLAVMAAERLDAGPSPRRALHEAWDGGAGARATDVLVEALALFV